VVVVLDRATRHGVRLVSPLGLLPLGQLQLPLIVMVTFFWVIFIILVSSVVLVTDGWLSLMIISVLILVVLVMLGADRETPRRVLIVALLPLIADVLEVV
jgi:hypothetical protein